MNAAPEAPPQKGAAAPKDGHKYNQTFAHGAENVKGFLDSGFCCDNNDASVIALAKELGCYDGLIAKAAERTHGGHRSRRHETPQRANLWLHLLQRIQAARRKRVDENVHR